MSTQNRLPAPKHTFAHSNLYVGIDALRCIAAFSVMCYHYLFLVGTPGLTPNRITNGLIPHPLLPDLTSLSYFGVPAFFVISGFVIYASLNANSAGQFLSKRFMRLAPALWICASVTLIVAMTAHDGSIGKILARYLISITFFPFGKQIDGSYWTLRIEVGFYLSIFFMMIYAKTKLDRYFQALCIGNFLVATVAFFGIAKREWLGNLGDLFVLHHGSYFAVGIYLNKLAVQKQRSVENWLLMLLAILGSYAHVMTGAEPEKIALLFWVWTGVLALIIFAVTADPLLSRLAGPTGAKRLRAVGKATYPFYLIHQLVGCFVIYLAVSRGASHVAAAALAFAVILMITLTVTLLEKQLVKALKPRALSFSDRLDQRYQARAAAE